MVAPNSITSGSPSVQIVSTATHQFQPWYDTAGELHIGRIERGVQRWGVNHQEYTFAGAPRTALVLPVVNDQHNYPSIAVDGLGRLHVWANMHANPLPLRAVRTVDPHTSDTWMSDAGWVSAAAEFPSIGTTPTYPLPVHLADGGLWFYLRDVGFSGRGDSHYWTRAANGTTWSAKTMLFQGLSVPDAGGPGIPGTGVGAENRSNFNAYPTVPYVESPRDPHPGRVHMSWVWRILDLDELHNVCPSYAYSDNGGTAWNAVDGTPLTLPIHPLNSVAARVPGSAMIRTIARGGNIVVAQVDTAAHGIQVGNVVNVSVEDVSYNGTFTVAVVGGATGPNGIAWGQVAADDPAGGVGSLTTTPYLNWGSITVDSLGLPHIVASAAPTVHIYRNAANSAWVQDNVSTALGGVTRTGGFGALFWFRGQLWGTAETRPVTGFHRVHLIPVTGTGTAAVMLSGDVGPVGAWESNCDPEAWRRFETVESPAPDGDWPHVFTFGNHVRVKAAA